MKVSTSPVSAFQVYKVKQQKQKPKKKRSKIRLSNGNTERAEEKIKKKLKLKFTHQGNHMDDDEEPPQLIEIKNVSLNNKPKLDEFVQNHEKKKKQKKVKKSQAKQVIQEPSYPHEKCEPPDGLLNLDENPCAEGLRLLQWMISPCSSEAFFSNYFENRPLHIERNKPRYYVHILDSTALDRIFRDNPLYYTRNVDVVSYENGKKQVFNQEGRAVPAALWDYYTNGCSIRVLNPQTYNKKVHVFVTTLQEYFGSMVGVNVYLTPPGSQGFAPHYDDIEAFVLQLEGRKYWKLYHPNENEVLARDSSHNFDRKDLGKPFMELALNAGDLLYFPRGVIHEGRTDEKNHSLHITVSVYQHNAYVDLLEKALPEALKRAAQDDIDFRKGLPLHFLQNVGAINTEKQTKVRAHIMKKVGSLMDKLVKYVNVDGAADQLGRKLMRDSMPPVLMQSEVGRSVKADGDFLYKGKVYNRIEFGMDTMVRLVRYHSMRLVVEDHLPKLYYCTENSTVYHGEEEQSLEIDVNMVPAVKMLQLMYPDYIRVEVLPIDDDISKVQFANDLWERGLLVTSEPLKHYDFEEGDDSSDGIEGVDEEI